MTLLHRLFTAKGWPIFFTFQGNVSLRLRTRTRSTASLAFRLAVAPSVFRECEAIIDSGIGFQRKRCQLTSSPLEEKQHSKDVLHRHLRKARFEAIRVISTHLETDLYREDCLLLANCYRRLCRFCFSALNVVMSFPFLQLECRTIRMTGSESRNF